jgi:putative aldouronate transport system substrate-binding protein
VNDALGATIEFNFLDGMEILDQVVTLLAGGDVVDITSIPGWALEDAPEFIRGVVANFEDLTPYLSGDIAERWPYLAGIPSTSWLGCIFDEKLMATPSWPGPSFGWRMYERRDILDEMGLESPQNADDLFELGKELNDPANGRWAFDECFRWLREIFRAPDGWRLEDGELVHEYETPEYEAALEFARKLRDNDLVHPDALADGGETQELFKAGNIIFLQDGTSGWPDMLRDMAASDPDFWLEPVPIFGHDGGDPLYRMSQDPTFTMIKKGLPEEQIEEIIDILNFFSSPWGSVEERLFVNGVEGEHHQIDADGNPDRLDLGHDEIVGSFEWLGGRVYGISGHSERYVRAATEWWNEAAQHRFDDPFLGIHVEPPARYKSADGPMDDLWRDIVRGREPVSAWADAVETWRDSGGEQGREFHMQVLEENDRV